MAKSEDGKGACTCNCGGKHCGSDCKCQQGKKQEQEQGSDNTEDEAKNKLELFFKGQPSVKTFFEGVKRN